MNHNNLQIANGNTWRRNRHDILKIAEPTTIFCLVPEDYEEPQTVVPHPPPTPLYSPPLKSLDKLPSVRESARPDPKESIPPSSIKLQEKVTNIKLTTKYKDHDM